MPDYAALSDADLVALLRTAEDRLPRVAAEEIVRRGERMIGPLASLLAEDRLWDDDKEEWWALVHATFLLAAGGHPAALKNVIEAIRNSIETEIDWIYDPVDALFAKFGPSAIPRLEEIVLDEDEEPLLATIALATLATHAAHGAFPVDKLLSLAATFVDDPVDENLDEESAFILQCWAFAGHRDAVLAALRIPEKRARKSFPWLWEDEEGEPEPPETAFKFGDILSFYNDDEIHARQELWEEQQRVQLLAQEGGSLLTDRPPETAEMLRELTPEGPADLPPPPVRNTDKVGRNDPCPCGSGKKFKKCCGA